MYAAQMDYADGNGISKIYAHLAILSSSDYVLTIWRVSEACHIVEVALLFHDICLTLPLPHQQLTQANTSQSNPVSSAVQCYR
jgi:hypothetical protein